MERRIEDYALIGDLHTAALVGRDGSIDWLCPECFDSPACFAALLGDENNGRWRLAPASGRTRGARRYRKDSLVLETEFEADGGRVRVTDFMPMGEDNSSVARIVTGLAGRVAMRSDLSIRFGYGRLVPWLSRSTDGVLTAVAGPHMLVLRTPAGTRGEGMATVSEFVVSEGDSVPFVLTYGASYRALPASFDVAKARERTDAYWSDWAGRCTHDGPWRDALVRSLITLKALTYAPTGGMVAAASCSLPEQPGGARNWDYRYCWLRDATFTLMAFMSAGYYEEAEAWRRWLVRAVAGAGNQVQPLYSVLGDGRLHEWEVSWLSGFGGARPVRVGNAAFGHLQLDVFGEVMDALHQARRGSLESTEASWEIQKELLSHVEEVLDQPDRGIWEMRGDKRHFTHSKVMLWVAFDRAVASVVQFGLDGPADRWRALRDRLHREICEAAYDSRIGAFVQSYGSRELDAACLLMPLVGFLPADDPRMVGTVKAIERELLVDGLVRRYDSGSGADGLEEGEGVFLACSFWLADNLILQGRREEGRALFERLLDLRNDVGLLAEEYDVAAGRQLGNFPQALSHLALIGTALNLEDHGGPAEQRSKGAADGS